MNKIVDMHNGGDFEGAVNSVPKVSIVIPVYNANDALLDRALGCIFAQTEQSFEIILVDDGSKNGCTERIAERFRNDCRLKIIHQENKGVEGAADTGIRNCRGDFFYSIAQDDFVHPQTLEYCLFELEREQADICIFEAHSQYDYATPACTRIEDFENVQRLCFSYVKTPEDDYIKGLNKLNMDGWGHFVRMSLVRKVHAIWPLYDSVARVHLMLTMANRWVRSSARLYYYNTVNPDSLSKKAIRDVFVERSRCDFNALYELYAVRGKSEKIWDAVRRCYVVKGVKMVVNAFRRRNSGCSTENNSKCLFSMGKMLREFFDRGMLPVREVNFRMYLYYKWIAFFYGGKGESSGLQTLRTNMPLNSFLSDFGSAMNNEKKSNNILNHESDRILNFPVHGDHSGSLVALEKGEDFPFEIKRVYYIWGTAKDVVRGHHAHRNLEQVIVCTSGSCDFILDDGARRETYHLSSPAQGLHIKNNVWREFTNFSPDCVVMVLASEHYNEADYIRDYGEFLRSVRKS